jgi:hypothetical protein
LMRNKQRGGAAREQRVTITSEKPTAIVHW